jgi:hypothetical protein
MSLAIARHYYVLSNAFPSRFSNMAAAVALDDAVLPWGQLNRQRFDAGAPVEQ